MSGLIWLHKLEFGFFYWFYILICMSVLNICCIFSSDSDCLGFFSVRFSSLVSVLSFFEEVSSSFVHFVFSTVNYDEI